jgi:hypothetical protein
MRHWARWWLFSGTFLLAPLPTLAQQNLAHVRLVPPASGVVFLHSAPATGRMPIKPVIRRIINEGTSSTSNAAQNSSATDSNFTVVGGAPINLDQLLNPSPSFGFSFEHLEAVNPDLSIKALIDPITEDRLAIAERLLRETPVSTISFPFFDTPSVVMVEQPPSVIILQQPQPVAPAPAAAPSAAAPPTPVAPPAEAPPPPDVGTFTLVLKDGTHLSAVAFTRQKGRIVYITKDGIRRSFSLSELDRIATEKLNEDCGISVELPQ